MIFSRFRNWLRFRRTKKLSCTDRVTSLPTNNHSTSQSMSQCTIMILSNPSHTHVSNQPRGNDVFLLKSKAIENDVEVCNFRKNLYTKNKQNMDVQGSRSSEQSSGGFIPLLHTSYTYCHLALVSHKYFHNYEQELR